MREIVAGERIAGARRLPFELGGKPLAGPIGEGICLVVADVRDGRARIDRQQAFQRHLLPDAVALFPVARRVPALRLHRRPAVGEPDERLAVAAGFHEGEPLAVGDAAVGEAIGIEQHLVARPLVVVRKAGAVVADGADAAVESDELRLGRAATGSAFGSGSR